MSPEVPQRRQSDKTKDQRLNELSSQLGHLNADQLAELFIKMEDDLSTALTRLRRTENADVLNPSILNRRGFVRVLGEEVAVFPHRGQFSVVSLDLIKFKAINEELGHNEGDRVLVWSTNLMLSVFRDIDDVARLGGDELAVLLRQTDANQAQKALSRLRTKLGDEKRRLTHDKGVQRVNFRYSIKQWQGGDTVEQFMAELDRAMYIDPRDSKKRKRL